jgi:predicted dehydrogenase
VADPSAQAKPQPRGPGELGDVYLFRTSLRDMTPPKPEFPAHSGGFFTDVTIHDLDVARWMVDKVVQVSAYGTALSAPGFAEIGDIDTAVVVLGPLAATGVVRQYVGLRVGDEGGRA